MSALGTLEEQAVQAFGRGDLVAAEDLLRRVVAQSATAGAVLNLAIVLFKLRKFDEAVRLFDAVRPHLPLTTDQAEAYSFALESIGDFDRSLAVREQLAAALPGEDSAVKLVDTLLRHGRIDLLDKKLPALCAQYPANERLLLVAANHALARGDFAQGFALMRRQLPTGGSDPRLAAYPPWDGETFAGKLLLPMEPHLGEELLVSYFLGDLVRAGQAAVVEVDARLSPLLRRAFPSLEFVARGTGSLAEHCASGDTCRRAEPVDLAQRFFAARVQARSPAWLSPDPSLQQRKREEYRARWPGKRLVGISWRSLRLVNEADLKSIPLTALRATLSVPDTVFVSIQYGDAAVDCAALAGSGISPPWIDPEIDATRDMEALAAQLCALDEVICVSNTTAHLAGALGVPVTVLLPKRYPVLWHWGYAGDTTPWYGAASLLRNDIDGSWAGIDAHLGQRLAGAARSGSDQRFGR